MECSERVSVAEFAASKADWEINISGTPREAAAAMMPGSLPFAAGVAIAVSVRLAVNTESVEDVRCAGWEGAPAALAASLAPPMVCMAASMAASTCSALTPERQPIPATIKV
jgi:hypothetical protein